MKKTAKPLSRTTIGLLSKIHPGNAKRMIAQTVDMAFTGLVEESFNTLGEVICAYPDEATREQMGEALRANFNVLRLGIDPGRREEMARTAHVIVSIPFTLEGQGQLAENNPLGFLTSRIDEALDHLVDPEGAGVPALVLAVPARNTFPVDLVALNYMLSNPESSNSDQEYARWWFDAMKTTLASQQTAEELPWYARQAFFYTFAMAVPGMTPAEAIEAPLRLTPYGEKVVGIIMEAVDRANRESDAVKIRLLEVQKLSEGIVRTQVAAVRKTLQSTLDVVNEMRTPETPEDPVAKLMLSTELTWNPVPAQFLCFALIGRSGSYRSMGRMIMSHGFPRAIAEEECRKLCTARNLSMLTLPPQVVHHYQKNELGVLFVRGEDNQWHDPSLLMVGPEAASILRTGEWAIGWDERFRNEESAAFSAELQALPDPVRQIRAGLHNVFSQHYTPAFLRDFLALAKRPGYSREACVAALDEEHGYPVLQLAERGYGQQITPTEQMYAAIHFEAARGALFVVRQRLLASLEETDLTDDYPLEGVRAPLAECYFHFEAPLRMEGGITPLTIEGFYVSEEITPATEDEPEVRRLSILPVTREGESALDVTSAAQHLDIVAGDNGTLATMFAKIDEAGKAIEWPFDKRPTLEFFKDFWRRLVKVLLYTTLPDMRRRDAPERTSAMDEAKQKSGKSRQKALDAAAKLYDYISIGPESDAEDDLHPDGQAGQGTKRKTHVRRGSFVWQPYGPNHSLRRTQWRRPTIVNLSKEDEASPKEYRVG